MKYTCLILILTVISCQSNPPTDRFSMILSLSETVLSDSQGVIVETVSEFSTTKSPYVLKQLADTAKKIDRQRDRFDAQFGVEFPASLILNVRPDASVNLLPKIHMTISNRDLNELRIIGNRSDGTRIRFSFVPTQKHNLAQQIAIFPDSIVVSSFHQPIQIKREPQSFTDLEKELELAREDIIEEPIEEYDPEEVEGKPRRHAAVKRARARVTLLTNRTSESSLPTRKFQTHTIGVRVSHAEFPKLLRQINTDLQKLGYLYGRHYVIQIHPDVSMPVLLDRISELIESIDSPGIQKAGFFDLAPPALPEPPPGKFMYHHGVAASFTRFSLSLGIWPDKSPVNEQSNSAEHRKHLLNIPGLIISAILDRDSIAINRYLDQLPSDMTYPLFEMRAPYASYGDRKDSKVIESDDDFRGYTVLHLAVSKRSTAVVRALIKRGLDVNQPSRTWTDSAMISGLSNLFSKTTKKEKPKTTYFTRGRVIRPIELARLKKYQEIESLLIAAGANTD